MFVSASIPISQWLAGKKEKKVILPAQTTLDNELDFMDHRLFQKKSFINFDSFEEGKCLEINFC